MHVDGTTTVGDLLKDVRTSGKAQQLFAGIMSQSIGKTEENNMNSQADEEMLKAILEGVPLKSLVSLGAITGEEQEKMINIFNEILKCDGGGK